MESLRLLVADDHEIVRKGLRSLLEAQPGWQVTAEASDGREAVEKAKELKPDVTVLDISAPALELARAGLGRDAARVRWLEQDLLSWSPDRRYDLWHDRAVFHFLIDPSERQRYADLLRSALRPGAWGRTPRRGRAFRHHEVRFPANHVPVVQRRVGEFSVVKHPLPFSA